MTNTQDHILVVISDTQITFLLDRVLRSAGFSVGIVQEGLAALKQAATVPPSLVILGERLSDGHGLEFASEFGRRFPAVPVVLLFYQDNQEQLKRAMRLGVNDFLAPPLRSEEILRSVKNGGFFPPPYQVNRTAGRSPRAGNSYRTMIQGQQLSGWTGGPSVSTLVGYFRSSAQNGRSE